MSHFRFSLLRAITAPICSLIIGLLAATPAFAAAPTLSVGDVNIAEGNAGTRVATFTVTMSAPQTAPVFFDVATANGTATAGSDYVARALTGQRIVIGATSKTFTVTINGDTSPEPNEYFTVNLSNPVGGATIADGQAIGVITNDDANPLPALSISDDWYEEGDIKNTRSFIVSLPEPAKNDISVDVNTIDGSATVADHDYAPTATTLVIKTGFNFGILDVDVYGDLKEEPNETFSVILSNPINATIADGQGIGTLVNDDVEPTPTISIADAEIVEGDEGVKELNFTITLSSVATKDIRVGWSTGDGTALTKFDFAPNWGGAYIRRGESTTTVTVPVKGDLLKESDEYFNVMLTDCDSAIIGRAVAKGWIHDNGDVDPLPRLSVYGYPLEGEGYSTGFTVELAQPAAEDVTFDIHTSDGTATAPTDYVPISIVGYTIPAGETVAYFDVQTNFDTTEEANENFFVNVSNVSGATVVRASTEFLIVNDDIWKPEIRIGDVSVFEGNSGTTTATFNISLSAAATWPVSFEVATANATATAGSDYVALPLTSQQIAAGQTSKTVSVTINGDSTFEADETFQVYLNATMGAYVADGVAVGTITNDDAAATPSLSIGDVSISEGNSGTKTATFTVSLSAASASIVSFDVASANGTARAGSDFVALSLVGQQIAAGQTSKSVSVTINGDTTVEGDETFAVNVSNVTGATVADGSAVGTITNDDSASGPTLSINDVTISEGNSLSKTATFTISLSQAQSAPVFVTVATANGTATSGSDYVAKTTTGLRIPIGQTSKTFAVTVNGDTTSEPDETFTVNLSNATGGPTIGDGQGVGTITNDDAAATPTLSIADASVSEGNSGTKTLTFTVSLSPTASGTVSYDIATSNGSASAGSDYVASSLVGQKITAGQGSKTFVVTINGDATVESDETFNVTLSNVSGATLGDGTAVGTISNDDSSGGGSGPTLTIADVAIIEGNALTKNLTFSVKLSAASTSAVTYNIATADGTATAGSDYTAKSQTAMSIAAGVTSKTFVVVIKGDRLVEPNETFTVTVSNVAGATVGDGQAVGTITNDDAAALSMARIDAKGLVDDIDDGNHQPQVAPGEYALLLADTANTLCRRAPNATVVAVEGVEHKQVLADLAEAANASCAGKPRYMAVMADKERRGFLVDEAAATVVDLPTTDAAGIASLHVLGNGHERAISVLVPPMLSSPKAERTAQLRAIGQSVQAQLKQDAEVRLALVGNVTVPGLVDLTARDFAKALPTAKTLPGERLLVSPALLKAYGEAKVQVAVPRAANEETTQVLQLQPADKR